VSGRRPGIAIFAGVCFLCAVNAVAQRAWLIAGLTLVLAVLAAFYRRLTA
jgi:hypothetical protein